MGGYGLIVSGCRLVNTGYGLFEYHHWFCRGNCLFWPRIGCLLIYCGCMLINFDHALIFQSKHQGVTEMGWTGYTPMPWSVLLFRNPSTLISPKRIQKYILRRIWWATTLKGSGRTYPSPAFCSCCPVCTASVHP